jgi:hypothetical protein
MWIAALLERRSRRSSYRERKAHDRNPESMHVAQNTECMSTTSS